MWLCEALEKKKLISAPAELAEKVSDRNAQRPQLTVKPLWLDPSLCCLVVKTVTSHRKTHSEKDARIKPKPNGEAALHM